MRFPRTIALAAALGLSVLTGCHSAHIEATVSNRSAAPLRLIEVDYPSASFGTQTLAPGADFHYRFKVLGSGPATVQWTDAAGHDHKSTGPNLRESDEGSLTVVFNASGGALWLEQFTNP
ncbi:MAG: hypothetical protein ABR910_07145 [Acidobacteriaceae bacterium]|jgi:hypothetical protein